jgi:hypothetical protein
LKKRLPARVNQKTFATAGVGAGIAFKRLLWSRKKAIPVPTPPGAKVFARFFQKALLACLASCTAPEAHAPLFAQRDFAPFSRASAVAVAMDEWRLWGSRVDDDGDRGYVQTDATMGERRPGLWQRVGEYWWEGMNAGAPEAGWTGKHDALGQVFPVAVNGAYAWSAAFICYVMRIAGAGKNFPYAPDHAFYINYAARAAEGMVRDPLLVAEDPARYTPRLGDLLCYGRGRLGRDLSFSDLPTGYSFLGHCSIVVGVAPGVLSEVGGNVEDAVAMTHVKLDGAGLVDDGSEHWLAVLRVMYAE